MKLKHYREQQWQVEGKHWSGHSAGRGRQLIIALHGFGEDSRIFALWGKDLDQRFSFVALDLPWHGRAPDWPAGDVQPTDLIRILDQLAEQYQATAIHLIGHSLGARMLLSIYKRLAVPPDTLWLLAPDGLATRRLGLVNRLPANLSRWIAQSMERWHPQWLRLAAGLQRLGLIDAFSVRFLRFHLANEGRRRRLMGIWRSLPQFSFDRKKLLQWAKRPAPALHLILGREDQLIDWNGLTNWLEKWPREQIPTQSLPR